MSLLTELDARTAACLTEALGYANFSSGATEPGFLRNINELYRWSLDHPLPDHEPWQMVGRLLREGVDQVRRENSPLGDAVQADAVLRLVFANLIPAYLRFHRDLLFHQQPGELLGPLLLGRMVQAVLRQNPPWEQVARVVDGAIAHLNDYVGYRPVAVLEKTRVEPYPHERVRPVPLCIAGVGAAHGRFHDLVTAAMDILLALDADLQRRSWFHPELLDELAYDPRAYDFDHPAHKRPNHQFGLWDPHVIDNRGYYRRYVVQQVTLDALLGRVERLRKKLPHDELLLEAAAVLAGTILMGSGTSGDRPETHGSFTTLSALLPHIAAYRDAFYERMLDRMSGAHARRLREEARRLQQPFGGARQDFNADLARRRATQLEHVHLAQVYAQMGYPEAAMRQVSVIPVASARLTCEMNCRLTSMHLRLDAAAAGQTTVVPAELIQHGTDELKAVEDLLHRAIQCGAMIDPWNILGFDSQFNLFNSPDTAIHDHRADELVEMIQRIVDLYVRLVSEAAAGGYDEAGRELLARLAALAAWWDQFATDQVSSVESISGREAYDSADQVGQAMAAWHGGGAASGDVAFWRGHVAEFSSPKTFARVVEALLGKHDVVAAMSLLIQWAGQAGSMPLEDGDDSFHMLAQSWLAAVMESSLPDRFRLVIRFFDYLEANAEEYWEPPRLELTNGRGDEPPDEPFDAEADDDEGEGESLFGAAYEGVVYRDSTADGYEGEVFDPSQQATDFELELESRRITDRLMFLSTVATLWKQFAMQASRRLAATDEHTARHLAGGDQPPDPQAGALPAALRDAVQRWAQQAHGNHRKLLGLLGSVHRYALEAGATTHEAMMEYDRRRVIKESLLERIIAVIVETQAAGRLLAIHLDAAHDAQLTELDRADAVLLAALVQNRPAEVERTWPELQARLAERRILYIPLARGGDPAAIARARSLHQMLHELLAWLPRGGWIAEAVALLDTIREMEAEHPVGPGAVTEFDRLFETGYKAIIDCLVASSVHWNAPGTAYPGVSAQDGMLIDVLQQATEPMLLKWLAHGQTLRLSVLERVDNKRKWTELERFIRDYGADLFTQYFMILGNLRAILHQGVEAWLDQMIEHPSDEGRPRLSEDVAAGRIDRAAAADHMTTILEAIIDNYSEYCDYNSTTTQSDRGDSLYMLLDFLRLKVGYERTYWNLKPIVMAHEMLVRRGRCEAAELWCRALAERTVDIADRLISQLRRLQKKYSMRLPSIADRIGERFVRPLMQDRIVALVRGAMEEAASGSVAGSFARLEEEAAEMTREPTGSGLDTPDWLAALEDEVDVVRQSRRHGRSAQADEVPLAQVMLPYDELRRQLDRIDARQSPDDA